MELLGILQATVPRGFWNLLDNNGEVVPKAKCNEQFRHHKHRTEQQVGGIVHKRRLSTFEYPMADDLRCDPDHNQSGGYRPHRSRRSITEYSTPHHTEPYT